MTEYHYTEKGYLKLKQEIDKLEKFIKQDIAQEIATARDHGDLKENAEYAAAKEKQEFYANRLRQMQERLTRASVVRRDELPEDTVTFGKRIKIKDAESGDEKEYIILGEGETDLDKGIISYQSPLANALITHKVGDVVDVQLPRGPKKFEVLEIEFYDDE